MLGIPTWAAILIGWLLIGCVLAAVPSRLRRRRPPARPPAAAPPPPVEPPPPRPERVMLRRDELLWHKPTYDTEGQLTLGLLAAPGGQLGVLLDDNGTALGVRLDRFEVQEMRDALTRHLVATSRPVTS